MLLSVFLADLDEKPTITTVWLLPVLFLLVAIGCWFYADSMRLSKGDRWWRWAIAYGFFGFSVYVSGAALWDFATNSFTHALVDARRTQISYYAAFFICLLTLIGFAIWHYLRRRFKHGELSY